MFALKKYCTLKKKTLTNSILQPWRVICVYEVWGKPQFQDSFLQSQSDHFQWNPFNKSDIELDVVLL